MNPIITDSHEAIGLLKDRLSDYLEMKGLLNGRGRKHFFCPFHNDKGKPNMALNARNDERSAYCFNCHKSADIFDFAGQLDGLPTGGEGFFTVTIPKLGEMLGLKIVLGVQSEASKLKALYGKLCQDISNELISHPHDYAEKRGWAPLTRLLTGSIDAELLRKNLLAKGWNEQFLDTSKMLAIKRRDEDGNFIDIPIIHSDKFTFVIQDAGGRPIGFIGRQIDYNPADETTSKYVHTPNGPLFEKSKCTFGIHADLKKCKSDGVYVVEGPGDLASLHSVGIFNAIAIMGTALTENHLLELKKLGIKKIILCLDSDDAGQAATERFIDNTLMKVHMSCFIKQVPSGKDVDEYIQNRDSKQMPFADLPELSVFDFKLERVASSAKGDIEQIVETMIPFIANEISAVKRSMLIKTLSEFTAVNAGSISVDVESFRNQDVLMLNQMSIAAARAAAIAIEKDPGNAPSIVSGLANDLSNMSSGKGRLSFGPNAQLGRFDALQAYRHLSEVDSDSSTFKSSHYRQFFNDISGGMPITRKALMYFGGRANHGKTLFLLGIAADVALNDPDALVIVHSIDDAYERVEPRLKANLYNMQYANTHAEQMTMDMVNSPFRYKNGWGAEALSRADSLFKDLLAEERLILFDGNDGRNLSFLRRAFRYYRDRFPNKKILSICDNTHDYEDFPEKESMQRMKMIASAQKQMTGEFDLSMMATVEYRKQQVQKTNGIQLPGDEDIADSRSMTYKPDLIYHIYNDLTARGDDAELFWKDHRGQKHPRLMGILNKNKLSGFKGRHAYDLIPGSIMIEERDILVADRELNRMKESDYNNMKQMDADFDE